MIAAIVSDFGAMYESDITLYEGEEALVLRIPMSSFGENQRFRATSEQQDRSSDYPVAAASSPFTDIMRAGIGLVKDESLIF